MPIHLLKAKAYGNLSSICSALILVLFVSLCLHYGGGIGLTYGVLGLMGYVILAGVL